MKKPNIFNYATSELSQDAMICYILEWAKKENKEVDENTHKIGVKLLDAFFEKYHDTIEKPSQFEIIDIIKQDNNIDVLCIVNNKYPIIIEDKTNTKNHGDQLERYYKQIKSRKEFDDNNIMCIYFKTYDQSCYDEIKKNKYKVFLRKEILDVLNSFPTENIIINDYKEYLQKIEDDVNSYQVRIFDEWYYDSWKGFFIQLKYELKGGNWGYVSNPSGGFLAYWFNWQDIEESQVEIYMQIEYHYKQNLNKFNIKLSNKNKVKIDKKITNKYMYGEKSVIKEYKNFKFIKPKKISYGKTMTIAELDGSFIIENEDKTVNIYKTVENIKTIIRLVNDSI